MDNTLETLGTIVWCNGWYDMLQEIKTYIQQEVEINKNEQYYNIGKPDFLMKIDYDLFPCIIWSILVLQCGDYETWPDTGWVEIKRVKDAIEIIDALCAKTEEYQSYN